ncbi:MAG: DivIVA domain-containing protein [Ruminococcus sp.]|nr:DivIVA domain-containing protein [Ruminococcus sp.]
MLTIDEIKDISFRRGRGYRGEDVDAFIDEVIVSFEQLKKEKSDLIRKMDILATRVEQYRADEETVRNALLSSQRVADNSIKEAQAKAAQIVADAEAKAQSTLKEANAISAKQKEVYLKLKNDSAELRKELEALYNSHLKSLNDLPTDAVVLRKQEELDKKYPTVPVEEETSETTLEAEETVEVENTDDVIESSTPAQSQDVEFVNKIKEDKFDDLKFGENYDVDAD